MEIFYDGNRSKYSKGERLAEIFANYDEQAKLDKVVEQLRAKGWEVDDGIALWAGVKVEDKSEYNELKEDYKIAKKNVKAR